jgi:hypothetical protein
VTVELRITGGEGVTRELGPLPTTVASTRRVAQALVPFFARASGRLPCHDVDPETFFPVGGQAQTDRTRRDHQRRVDAAKALCTGGPGRPACPVLQACRDYAIDNLPSGIWGGLDEDDRAAITGRWPSSRTRRGPS